MCNKRACVWLLIRSWIGDGSLLESWRFSNAETVNYQLLLLNYLVDSVTFCHEYWLFDTDPLYDDDWRLSISSVLLILISLWQKEIIFLRVTQDSCSLSCSFLPYLLIPCIRSYMWFTFLSIYATKSVAAFFLSVYDSPLNN